ncbi:MAG: YcbK family protein [Thiobacillus sp.]
MKHIISRRKFIKLGMLAAALPAPAFASRGASTSERRLSLSNLHTGEKADLPYWIEGQYVPESLAEINHVLRDHRTGQVAAIDTQLLDLLHHVNATLGTSRPFHVISGYRSPASNRMLSSHSSGVAKHSLHMEGKAIDIRLPGIPLADLHRTGLKLQGGGVGYYPGSNFVHLDVGRVRTWGG